MTLNRLPLEILFEILNYLEPYSLVQLSKTNLYLKSIIGYDEKFKQKIKEYKWIMMNHFYKFLFLRGNKSFECFVEEMNRYPYIFYFCLFLQLYHNCQINSYFINKKDLIHQLTYYFESIFFKEIHSYSINFNVISIFVKHETISYYRFFYDNNILPENNIYYMYLNESSKHRNYEIMVPIRFDYDDETKKLMVDYLTKYYEQFIFVEKNNLLLDFEKWKNLIYRNYQPEDERIEFISTNYEKQYKIKIHSGIRLDKMYWRLIHESCETMERNGLEETMKRNG